MYLLELLITLHCVGFSPFKNNLQNKNTMIIKYYDSFSRFFNVHINNKCAFELKFIIEQHRGDLQSSALQ